MSRWNETDSPCINGLFFSLINRSRAKNSNFFFFWTLSWIIYFSPEKPKRFVHYSVSSWQCRVVFCVFIENITFALNKKKKKCVYDTSYIIFVQHSGISSSINQFQRTPICLDIVITFNRNARIFTLKVFQRSNRCNYYYYYFTFDTRPSHAWYVLFNIFLSTFEKIDFRFDIGEKSMAERWWLDTRVSPFVLYESFNASRWYYVFFPLFFSLFEKIGLFVIFLIFRE